MLYGLSYAGKVTKSEILRFFYFFTDKRHESMLQVVLHDTQVLDNLGFLFSTDINLKNYFKFWHFKRKYNMISVCANYHWLNDIWCIDVSCY